MNIARYLMSSMAVSIPHKSTVKDFKYLAFEVFYWSDGWNSSWQSEVSGDELRQEFRKAVRQQDKWMSVGHLPGERPKSDIWNVDEIVVKTTGNLYKTKDIVEEYCERRYEIVAGVFFDKECEKSEFDILIDDLSVQFVGEDGKLRNVDGSYFRK